MTWLERWGSATNWTATPTSPESVFGIAGVHPLKMHVVGVLERAFSPDDRAVFVDLKTARMIEGHGHGGPRPAAVAASGEA